MAQCWVQEKVQLMALNLGKGMAKQMGLRKESRWWVTSSGVDLAQMMALDLAKDWASLMAEDSEHGWLEHSLELVRDS